jgi:eukaryotic-like serine/threonine-protein kinase
MNDRSQVDETVDHPSAGPSVLQSLAANLSNVPRIRLRESLTEGVTPVNLPNSTEMSELNSPQKSSSRLQLISEIARGGMGAILKGRDVDLGRDLAIKVLLEEHRGKTDLAQRFIEEAQIAGQLQHPGITPVYELGVLADGRPYFTMKLVKGQTLAALLAARKDVQEDWPRFLGVFAQVCQTLAYAQAHGVIHRDLKPSNIMVGAFGEVQVMDWGLAKVLSEGSISHELSREREPAEVSVIRTARSQDTGMLEDGSHTQAGTLLGTPAYMAPEQARGDVEQVDERADVFGLGAILCEILTGQPPYTGKGAEVPYKARTAKLDDAYQRLQACGADAELMALARRCLAAESCDRPRHAGEVADQVTAYQNAVAERLRQAELARAAEEARVVEARATAAQERKARRMTLALAGSVLLTVLLGGGGWLWLQGQRAARLAENNRAVNEALTHATTLREQARTAQARTALDLAARAREQARRAEALVESGPADAALAEQVQGLLTELDADEKDRQLLTALDAIHLMQYDIESFERVLLRFREAFRAFGMPAGEGKATDAAEYLAKRPVPVREAVLGALDEWISQAENHPMNEPHLEWLRAVVAVAEPEGWRKKVRDAAAEKDLEKRRAALEKLAETADVEHLPVQRVTMLATRLQNAQAGASAVALLRRAQVWHAEDFWINEHLGLALGKQQPAEAVRYLTAAAALRSNDSGAHLNLGNALLNQGRRDEAIPVLRKATKVDPAYALPHHSLALGLWNQGHFDESLAEFRKAIDLYPKNRILQNNLGPVLRQLAQLLLSRSRGEEARLIWQKSLENDPPDHDAWYGYAELCLYLGQEDAYRRNRRVLLERFGNTTDPVIAERTARACLLLPLSDEDLQPAAALADRAVLLGAKHRFYQFFLATKGLAEYRRGQFGSAIDWFQKAGVRGVWMPVTRPVLAMALHRSGQTRQAQEALAAAVSSINWNERTADNLDKWIAHVLRREAEELIETEKGGTEKGTP